MSVTVTTDLNTFILSLWGVSLHQVCLISNTSHSKFQILTNPSARVVFAVAAGLWKCTESLCKHFVRRTFPLIPTTLPPSLGLWSNTAHSCPALSSALTGSPLFLLSLEHPAHFKDKCVCWWPSKTNSRPGLCSLCHSGRKGPTATILYTHTNSLVRAVIFNIYQISQAKMSVVIDA